MQVGAHATNRLHVLDADGCTPSHMAMLALFCCDLHIPATLL